MSKADTFENALLLLIFNNTAIANVGDAGGIRSSVAAGSLYFSLHTADPGEEGTQVTSEISYTGYARAAVARAAGAGGFTVTADAVVPASNVDFPASTGGTGGVATHFGIGLSSGVAAGNLLYKGTLSPTITVANGVTPRITPTGTSITEG